MRQQTASPNTGQGTCPNRKQGKSRAHLSRMSAAEQMPKSTRGPAKDSSSLLPRKAATCDNKRAH